jgi:hypothetical protein
LALHPFAVERVVKRGDRLSQLEQAGNGRVFFVVGIDHQFVVTRRRAGKKSGLRLSLAEIAPRWVPRFVAGAPGFGGDVDDAGAGHRTKAGDRREVGHEASIA